MAISLTCPNCNIRLTYDLQATMFVCKKCGYRPGTGLDEKAAELKAKGPRQHISITDSDKHELNPRVISLFENAQDALYRDDKAMAVQQLQASLALDPDFVDAYLWLAKLSDDEKSKREYLSEVLARESGHGEATKLMLILNKRLTPEQVSRAEANQDGPVIRKAEGAVSASIQQNICPNCGGRVELNEATGLVYCTFCGYKGAPAGRQTGSDSLLAALLERRAQGVIWQVGERILHCKNCGAQRIITGDKLSSQCPFCATQQVIVQDALGSFTQPDGLLPFRIDRAQAGAAIKEALKGFSQRVMGWFDNNEVARATLKGYYIPFWLFDAMVDVTRTLTANPSKRDRYQMHVLPTSQTEKTSDALYDVPICAAGSPAPDLMKRLGDFAWGESQPYAAERLVEYPAELYTLDIDRAALDARSFVSAAMRRRHDRKPASESEYTVSVFTAVSSMSYRLMLAPVWVSTLVEKDGDVRTALVNGQSGTVALGKARSASE